MDLEEDITLGEEGSFKVRMISSASHLNSAAFLGKKCREMEDQYQRDSSSIDSSRHTDFASTSIVSTGNFLEAQINELIFEIMEDTSFVDDLDEDKRSFVGGILNSREINLRRIGCLDKYQLLLALFELNKFERGTNPYQDTRHVWWFRNYLVHGKTKFYPAPTEDSEEDIEDLGRYINQSTERNPITGPGNPDFPDGCMNYDTVYWCIKAVLDLSDEFFLRLDLDPRYNLDEIIEIIEGS